MNDNLEIDLQELSKEYNFKYLQFKKFYGIPSLKKKDMLVWDEVMIIMETRYKAIWICNTRFRFNTFEDKVSFLLKWCG